MGIKCVHIPVPLNAVCREKNPHDYQENRRILSSSTSILIERVVDKFKFECKIVVAIF